MRRARVGWEKKKTKENDGKKIETENYKLGASQKDKKRITYKIQSTNLIQ